MGYVDDANDSIESQSIHYLAELVQKDLDDHILCELLVSMGWFKVNITDSMVSRDNDWMSNNIKNKFKKFGKTCVFENENDAATFILKWS